MSVYNSGVKTMTAYTILSYTTYCHFAIKSFDLEGWVVGVVVTVNRYYRVNKSVGHLKQLSACDCAFANNLNIALSRRVVKIIAFTLTLKFRTRHCIVATSDRGCGWRRGGVQTKTSEGGRIKMSADYYYFAPTGGRYQTVFRGTLPRRYSVKRSQRCNTSPPTLEPPPSSALPSHSHSIFGVFYHNYSQRQTTTTHT